MDKYTHGLRLVYTSDVGLAFLLRDAISVDKFSSSPVIPHSFKNMKSPCIFVLTLLYCLPKTFFFSGKCFNRSFLHFWCLTSVVRWRHNKRHNDIKYNGTQHNGFNRDTRCKRHAALYHSTFSSSMLKVVVLCHYVECHYAECHYAECHYAECHYAGCHYAESYYAYFLCCVFMLSVIMLSVEAQAIWFKHFSFLTRLGKLECLSLTSISILTLYLWDGIWEKS